MSNPNDGCTGPVFSWPEPLRSKMMDHERRYNPDWDFYEPPEIEPTYLDDNSD